MSVFESVFVGDADSRRIPLTRNVFAAGRYIAPDGVAFSTSTFTIAADTLYCMPLSQDVDVDALCIAVTTGAAGAARMGLYACGLDGEPTTLIDESAPLDTTNIATVVGALAGARRLTEPVWLVLVANATPTLAAFGAAPAGQGHGRFGATSMTAAGATYGFSVAFPYAALPASFPPGTKTSLNTVANIPALAARTA